MMFMWNERSYKSYLQRLTVELNLVIRGIGFSTHHYPTAGDRNETDRRSLSCVKGILNVILLLIIHCLRNILFLKRYSDKILSLAVATLLK